MAIASLTFVPAVRQRTKAVTLDYELFETAIALFEAGKTAESIQAVFRHLFPNQTLPDLATTAFSFAQGSSRVNVSIAAEHISIVVPLVTLPSGGNGLAALRYLLTKLSSSGQLHQPRLHGDDVYLEFHDRVSRMHPAKLIEVLRRIPIEADNNDDWLIGQFAALPLQREPIPDVTDEEFTRAAAIWRSHWNDIEELVKESQRKRSSFFLNELTAYSFYRVRYALPLNGFLHAKLAEYARTFNDSGEDPIKRENTLNKCIKEMKAVSDAELRRDLGHPSYAISPHGDGTPTVLASYFGPGTYADSIEQYRKTGKSMEAAMALISTFTFLLGRYAWPDAIEADLQRALADASGKTWREVATLLTDHGKALVEKYVDDDDEHEALDPEEVDIIDPAKAQVVFDDGSDSEDKASDDDREEGN